MSQLILSRTAAPSVPSSTKQSIFSDQTDGRLKLLDGSTGLTFALSHDGLRGHNMLINGSFDIAQRQVPGTATTYSNTSGRAYSADRWGITNENTSVQYQRIDNASSAEVGVQSPYYGRFTKITNAGKIVISQVVEGINCLHLRGRQVRVQLRMKASASKTIRVALLQLTAAGTLDTIPATFVSGFSSAGIDPTFGTNLSALTPTANTQENSTISGAGISCTVTTSWTRYGFVVTLPTDFKNLVLVVFTGDQFAANDHFSIAEAGLYDGGEIREWVPGNQTQQLAACQRYYTKSFPLAVAPAQSAGLAGAQRGHVSVAGATANQPIGIRFPVSMRVAPTTSIVIFNPSAVNAFIRNTTAGTDSTASASANVSDSGTDIIFTGIAAWTVAQALAVHYTADAEL